MPYVCANLAQIMSRTRRGFLQQTAAATAATLGPIASTAEPLGSVERASAAGAAR